MALDAENVGKPHPLSSSPVAEGSDKRPHVGIIKRALHHVCHRFLGFLEGLLFIYF